MKLKTYAAPLLVIASALSIGSVAAEPRHADSDMARTEVIAAYRAAIAHGHWVESQHFEDASIQTLSVVMGRGQRMTGIQGAPFTDIFRSDHDGMVYIGDGSDWIAAPHMMAPLASIEPSAGLELLIEQGSEFRHRQDVSTPSEATYGFVVGDPADTGSRQVTLTVSRASGLPLRAVSEPAQGSAAHARAYRSVYDYDPDTAHAQFDGLPHPDAE